MESRSGANASYSAQLEPFCDSSQTRREVSTRHAPVYEVLEEPERFAGIRQTGDPEAHAALVLRFGFLLRERIAGAIDHVVHRPNDVWDVGDELITIELKRGIESALD